MPQKNLHVTPKVSCFCSKYVIKATEIIHVKRKLTESSGAKPGSDFLQSSGSIALFYPISIMPQISTKDSGILCISKNAKTNHNIMGYHVVSGRLISTSSDIQHVYRCPKRIILFPEKHVSVSNMLL